MVYPVIEQWHGHTLPQDLAECVERITADHERIIARAARGMELRLLGGYKKLSFLIRSGASPSEVQAQRERVHKMIGSLNRFRYKEGPPTDIPTLDDMELLPDDQTVVPPGYYQGRTHAPDGDPYPGQVPIFEGGRHAGWSPKVRQVPLRWWEEVKARGGRAYVLRQGSIYPGHVGRGKKEPGTLPVFAGIELRGRRPAPDYDVYHVERGRSDACRAIT